MLLEGGCAHVYVGHAEWHKHKDVHCSRLSILKLHIYPYEDPHTSTHMPRYRMPTSAFMILEMNRSKDSERLNNPAHTWHTCYASVKEGNLRVWPLLNKFVARNVGDSGMQLVLSPEDGK